MCLAGKGKQGLQERRQRGRSGRHEARPEWVCLKEKLTDVGPGLGPRAAARRRDFQRRLVGDKRSRRQKTNFLESRGCLPSKSCGFDLWVGRVSWRRAWHPTPAFLLENPWTEEPGGLQPMGSQSRTGLSKQIEVNKVTYSFCL